MTITNLERISGAAGSAVFLLLVLLPAADLYAQPKPSNGLFPVCLGRVSERFHCDGKYGYIDKTGKMLISPQFDDAGSFFDGLAGVRTGPKWGYIDKTGKMVISAQVDFARPFSEGLAGVRTGPKWGYIDKTGKMVIPPQFDQASDFLGGLARVMVVDKDGYIDKTGKFVWQAKD